MALDNGNLYMPVAPAYGNNGGLGFGGADGWWILLLLLFANGGMWGGFGGGAWGMDGLYPWMNNSQNINNGFRDQMLNDNITSIRDGVNSVQTQLCNGFAGVNATVANGFAQSEIAANSRQMANMNQIFGLSQQFADCCCENRLAACQTQNIIQNEGNATRFADATNTRDLLTAFNSGIQSLKDQLCDYRNEQKDDTIAQLRSELMYARGQASQDVQTAAIQAGQRALANEVEQYVLPTPRPAYVVQNPNCCVQNYGCGCA